MVQGRWIDTVLKPQLANVGNSSAEVCRELVHDIFRQIGAVYTDGKLSDDELPEAAALVTGTLRSRPDVTVELGFLSAHQTFTIPLPEEPEE